MKLLLFADTHSDMNDLDTVIKKSKNADLIICLGDLTMFQSHMKQMLKKLDKIGKKVLMLPGNHELEEDLQDACYDLKNVQYFHMDSLEIDDYLFLSYGSGGFVKEDLRFERTAKKWEKIIKKKHKIILLTHGPPHGAAVDIIDGHHAGNKSATRFIKKYKPVLAACGHLHENHYKIGKIGKTVVLNPGPEGRLFTV